MSPTIEKTPQIDNPIIVSHSLSCLSVSPPSCSQKEISGLRLFLLALEGKKILNGPWSKEREDLPYVGKEKRMP